MNDQLDLFPKPEPLASILYETHPWPPPYITRIHAAIEAWPGLEIWRCSYIIFAFSENLLEQRRGITVGLDLWGKCLVHEINPKYISGKRIDEHNQLYLRTLSLDPDCLIAFENRTSSETEIVPITEEQKQPWREFLRIGDHLGQPGAECLAHNHRCFFVHCDCSCHNGSKP
jgi:hypothetical protein